MILGVLSLVLSPVVIWGRNLVLDTSRYVQTLEPLASNPGVQNSLIAAVDKQVDTHLDVQSLVGQALPAPAAKALSGPLQTAVEAFVNKVTTTFVQSAAFKQIWIQMNRVAHEQIVNLLTGKPLANGVIKSNSDTIVLDLGQVVQNVKSRLVAAGITVASSVPAVGAVIQVAHVKGLSGAQSLVRALDTIADWLPLIGIGLVGASIALARRRRRRLVASAVGLAGGMLVLGAALLAGRYVFLSQLPGTSFPRSTSAYIFDTLVRYLRLGIRLVFLAALIVGLVVWVTGGSTGAVRLRAWSARMWSAFGRGGRSGQFVGVIARHINVVRAVIVGGGLLVLLLLDGPSYGTVILVGAIVVVLLLVAGALRHRGEEVVPAGPKAA